MAPRSVTAYETGSTEILIAKKLQLHCQAHLIGPFIVLLALDGTLHLKCLQYFLLLSVIFFVYFYFLKNEHEYILPFKNLFIYPLKLTYFHH